MKNDDPNNLMNALNLVCGEFGPDITVRQLATLVAVAQAGHSGTDVSSVERKTHSSQAAASRTLKMLAVEKGFVEYFLDSADGRLRLCRLTKSGQAFLSRLLRVLG